MISMEASDTKEIKNVTDIIDIEYLQEIQDSLSQITKTSMAIVDTEGRFLTEMTNQHTFCRMLMESPKGSKVCAHTDAQLVKLCEQTKDTATATCPHTGLEMAAVPIFMGERFLGAWLIGQVRTNELDEALFERTALENDLPASAVKENIEEFSIISEQELRQILHFAMQITFELTHLAEVSHSVATKNKELYTLANNLDYTLTTFKEFINLSDIGVYLIDYETGELIMTNNVYAQFAGKSGADLVGDMCYLYMGMDDWCDFCPRAKVLDENGKPGAPYVWENYIAKSDTWLRITSKAIYWLDGRLTMMVTYMDITERKKEEERIARLAYYDQRLNIPNALKLLSDIAAAESVEKHLIVVDVQGLRKINGIYGRDSGDNLLLAILEWIYETSRQKAEIYRIESDAFAILLKNETDEEAMKIADTIWNRFKEAWKISLDVVDNMIYAGATIGVIPFTEKFDTYSDMVNMIESVLETAKKGNAPLKFDQEMNNRIQEHLRMEMSLKTCVMNQMQGFSLCYQPIVDPESGVWQGLEALCRWESPDIGRVPPDVFIHEAEQMGLISLVGDWVLREAIAQVKEWGLDRNEAFLLDVNLSPLQLNDADLHARVVSILKEYDYPPSKLSLEITESEDVQFSEHIVQCLEQIRETGVILSLDDFGTGYASFSKLGTMPIKILKTDRSFVNNIENDTLLQHTVRMMIEFAHMANIQVIAEGVETAEQKELLMKIGADFIQGYYYSKPLTAGQIAEKLQKFYGATGKRR